MNIVGGTMSIVDGTMNINGSSIYGTMRINGGTTRNGCKVVQPCTFTYSTTFTDSMHIYGFKVPYAFLMIPPRCDHLIIPTSEWIGICDANILFRHFIWLIMPI